MNATDAWKSWYLSMTRFAWYSKAQCREEMTLIRREAALERIIARQAREIEAQAERITEAQDTMIRVLPILKEDISAIGDDHSVGICCCEIIYLAQDIEEWLDPEKKRQREYAESLENEL